LRSHTAIATKTEFPGGNCLSKENSNRGNPRILAKPAFKVAAGAAQGSSCVSLYKRLQADGFPITEWTPLKMLTGRYDILHLHWPDNILSDRRAVVVSAKMLAFFMSLVVVRLRRKKVVWTAHNLQSHEQRHPILEKIYWWVFANQLDGIIAPLHFIGLKVRADRRFKQIKEVRVLPFGDWGDFFHEGSRITELRHTLGVPENKRVVLWFGAVRRYKGVETLIQLFAEDSLRDIVLVIAGACSDNDYYQQLNSLARNAPNIILKLEFIPDEEVGDYFGMANICVFPFRAVDNTGSVRLALTFHRHVVVPDLPFAHELQEVLGDEWFTIYPNGELSTSHIFQALDHAQKVENQRVNWGDYNWDVTAEKTASFFRDLVSSGQIDS
jgi:beta-1,4-mannosyltransferase